MARSGSGGHYLRTTATIADPFNAAYTLHCLVKSSVAPNVGSLRPTLGFVGNASQQPQNILNWDHTSASFSRAAEHRQSGGVYKTAQTTTVPSANVWHSFGQVFNGSALDVYLDGVKEATTTSVAVSATRPVFLFILGQVNSSGALDSSAQFSNGEIAEVAMWSAALTADDMNALAKGFSPLLVRPQALVSYIPLIRPTRDPVRGDAWSEINSPISTDHPRVF